MTRRILVDVLAAVMVLVLTACGRHPEPIPVGTDTYSYGHIVEGGKFGLKIGQSFDQATDILQKRGFSQPLSEQCKGLKSVFECQEDDVFYSFGIDRFLRHGLVFIRVDDGKVTAIAWTFTLFGTLDF